MKLPIYVVKINHISFQNVVKKRMKFHYSQMEANLDQFISGIVESGYNLEGPFFYSLNNTPLDEIMDVEMFMPISNTICNLDGYEFSSYFEIENLLKTVVKGNFYTMTEQGFAKLMISLEENDFDIVTPFYHFFPKDGLNYLELLVGYSDISE